MKVLPALTGCADSIQLDQSAYEKGLSYLRKSRVNH